MTRALFIGRFQPFHNGHLSVVKTISKKFDELIIGIGSSQEKNTFDNPFSYKERKEMIKAVMKKHQIKNYKIFPSPDLYDDEKWIADIEKRFPVCDVVFSGNQLTLRCFRKHRYKVKKIKLVRGISSTKIRSMIAQDENWQKFVPKEVVKYATKIKGIERIRKIYEKTA